MKSEAHPSWFTASAAWQILHFIPLSHMDAMGDVTTIIPRPRHAGKGVPSCFALANSSGLLMWHLSAVQKVNKCYIFLLESRTGTNTWGRCKFLTSLTNKVTFSFNYSGTFKRCSVFVYWLTESNVKKTADEPTQIRNKEPSEWWGSSTSKSGFQG